MIAEEETANRLDELRNVLRVSLLKTGILGNLRAQLRLSALEILKGAVNTDTEHESPSPIQSLFNTHQVPQEGTPDHVALLLVFDFLNHFSSLKKSSGIFGEESGLCLSGDRFGINETKDLACQMKMNSSEFNPQLYSKEPLLVSAVRKMMNGNSSVAAPETNTNPPTTVSTSTTPNNGLLLPLDALSLKLERKTLAPVGSLDPSPMNINSNSHKETQQQQALSLSNKRESPINPAPTVAPLKPLASTKQQIMEENQEGDGDEQEQEPFVATNFLRSITADAIKNAQIQQQMIPTKQFFAKEFRDTTLSAAEVVKETGNNNNHDADWDEIEQVESQKLKGFARSVFSPNNKDASADSSSSSTDHKLPMNSEILPVVLPQNLPPLTSHARTLAPIGGEENGASTVLDNNNLLSTNASQHSTNNNNGNTQFGTSFKSSSLPGPAAPTPVSYEEDFEDDAF